MNAPDQNETSQAGLCSLQAMVEAGQTYRLRLPATDVVKGANPRAMVAQVRFLDEGGEEIVANYAGCFNSERYGQYVYLASSVGLEDTPWSEQAVTAPEAAASIKVVVHAWKASRALEIHEPLQVAADSDTLFEYEAEVRDGLPYRLHLSLADAEQSNRAAVVRVCYLDTGGQALPGPYGGCHTSPRYGQYFYASASKGEAREVAYPLFTPAGAVRVILSAYRWKARNSVGVAVEPRLECCLPASAEEPTDWLAIGPKGREIEVPVPASSPGRYVLLKGEYMTGPGAVGNAGLRATLHFHGEGMALNALPEGVFAERAFRLGGSTEERTFECFVWCPPGAASATLRILPETGTFGALVHGDVAMAALGELEAAARMQARLGVGGYFEHRVPVQPEWRSRIDFEGLRVRDPLGSDIELCVSFDDAQGRILALSGIDTQHSAGMLRRAGNRLYLKPDAGASGDPGVAHLRASLQILPPPGAHTLTVGLQNASGSEVPYTCSVEPCDALAEDRLEPRSAAGAVRVELHSPEAARLMIQRLLDRHPDDPAVLAGAIDVYRRLGDAGQLEEVASRAMAAPASGGKLKFKARHVLASLQEMDPDWRVEVPGSWSPAQKGERSVDGLRVAHLFKTSIPYENTGGAIRCMNIVKFQKKMGMDPLVVTPLGYPKKNLSGAPWEKEDVDGVPHYRLNGLGRDDLRTIPSTVQLEYTALLAANLLREQGVDLVQASSGYRGYEQALVGLAISRKLQVPFVYEVRSYHEHTWRQMADWVLGAEFTRRRMAQEDRCMREADAVVTICETMKLGLIERGVDQDKIFVIPNSIDADAFVPAPLDPSFKRSLGLTEPVTAGYISNVSAREGHHVLLRAVAEARMRGVPLDCLVVGDGPELENLKSLAASLGISGHVVFTGEVPHEDIPDYYSAIDIFVVPRVADFASDFVTPMKPFEAMAMKRAVVISDRPALQEIVTPGLRGEVFESGNYAMLAEKLVLLSKDDELRRRYADNGHGWVMEERTWDKTILGYSGVYAAVFQRHATRS